ncbi:hypothetical protein, unlikely [Trypanosoma congolense IL3000]|uniref:Uncharacterized protein n=1 Tax=Trypanosoma congolense (strain IL3000) TaxID=1068625 RepID=F9WIY3_TRYCI|nr:hypothetical protein, unlikely [Trypanosoma congolense IL3000]
MALKTGTFVVHEAVLRRIWDLILRLTRSRVAISLQFVFSYCEAPRNKTASGAAGDENARPQNYPPWITDIVVVIQRQCRSETLEEIEESHRPRVYPSVHSPTMLDHLGKKPSLHRLREALLAHFHTSTSMFIEWSYGMLICGNGRIER